MIPVQRPYLGNEELAALRKVFDSRWLGMGSTTKDFEKSLRDYLGTKHVITVNSGTSALHLAMDSLGLRAGDQVLVPSLTFVATVQAILAVGATPVFCDILEETFNLDPEDLSRRLTSETKAVIPVHYGGVACKMDEILAISRANGLSVIDDAAHAFGSTYKGRPIGGLSDATCFSFDPVKNITCGEGGAIATNRDDIALRAIPRRILGISCDSWTRLEQPRAAPWPYKVETQGYRYHLANTNAAIGLVQLSRADEFRTRKREIVARYDEAFAGTAGLTLPVRNLSETFPFFYVVRVLDGQRDALLAHLREHEVGSGVHYIPNHLQPLFAQNRVTLPVTELIFEEVLTLPMYFEMTDLEVEKVIDTVQVFFRG